MDDTANLLAQREMSHGSYPVVARLSQELKRVMRCGPGYSALAPEQQESLEMLAVKVARLVCGTPIDDHWADIEGYARLARQQIQADAQADAVAAQIVEIAVQANPPPPIVDPLERSRAGETKEDVL